MLVDIGLLFYFFELNHRLVDTEEVLGLQGKSLPLALRPSPWPCLGLEGIVLGLVSSGLDSKSDAHA